MTYNSVNYVTKVSTLDEMKDIDLYSVHCNFALSIEAFRDLFQVMPCFLCRNVFGT